MISLFLPWACGMSMKLVTSKQLGHDGIQELRQYWKEQKMRDKNARIRDIEMSWNICLVMVDMTAQGSQNGHDVMWKGQN